MAGPFGFGANLQKASNILLRATDEVQMLTKGHEQFSQALDVGHLDLLKQFTQHIVEFGSYRSHGRCYTKEAQEFVEEELANKIEKLIKEHKLKGLLGSQKTRNLKTVALEIYQSLIAKFGLNHQKILEELTHQINLLLARLAAEKGLEKTWREEEIRLREQLTIMQKNLHYLLESMKNYYGFLEQMQQNIKDSIELLQDLQKVYSTVIQKFAELEPQYTTAIAQTDATLHSIDGVIAVVDKNPELDKTEKIQVKTAFKRKKKAIEQLKNEIEAGQEICREASLEIAQRDKEITLSEEAQPRSDLG
jgi:uncharacterized protein YajQ (UPF0234 family)